MAASPPLLSLASFYGKNPKYKRGTGAYTRYVHDYKVHELPAGQLTPGLRPSTAGAPAQPLNTPHAPTVAAHALAATKADTGYMTDAQIQAKAKQLVEQATAPLLAQLNKNYDTSGAQSAAAIAAADKEYEKAVAQYGPAVAGAYQGAEGAQAGTDSALAQLLTGGGTSGAADLAAKLGNAPGSAEAQAGAQGVARGAAGASLGTGSADLTALISKGAGEASYGAKLPGLAALTGLQDTAAGQAANETARRQALGQATSSEPGSILSLYQSLANNQATQRNQDLNRAQTAKINDEIYGQNAAKTSVSYAESQAKLKEQIRKDTLTARNQSASIQERQAATAEATQLRQQAADETARHNRATEATAAKNAAKKPGAKAASGKRQSAFYGARTKAFKDAKSLHDGVTTTDPLGDPVVKKAPVTDWRAAYNTLWNQYAPQLLSQYSYTHAAVAQMIRRALVTAGYKVS